MKRRDGRARPRGSSGILARTRMAAPRPLLALTLGAALLLGAAPASAFCRSTTCTGGDCPRDENECKTTGAPLSWPGVCVGFSLQRDGTANLEMDAVRQVIERSFVTWTDIPCSDGSGNASIAFSARDDVGCRHSEYNESGANANVILFQDDKWRYHGPNDTLAKTTVTFDSDDGTILDADIEVNHAYNEFTIGDDAVVYDLESVLTHEIGHFLGLDHTPDIFATMYAGYDEGSIEQRTLELDDVDALCAVYPPNRSGDCDPTPRGGLGNECLQEHTDDEEAEESGGCALAGSPRANATAALLLVSGLALEAWRRRIRWRRPNHRERSGRRAERGAE